MSTSQHRATKFSSRWSLMAVTIALTSCGGLSTERAIRGNAGLGVMIGAHMDPVSCEPGIDNTGYNLSDYERSHRIADFVVRELFSFSKDSVLKHYFSLDLEVTGSVLAPAGALIRAQHKKRLGEVDARIYAGLRPALAAAKRALGVPLAEPEAFAFPTLDCVTYNSKKVPVLSYCPSDGVPPALLYLDSTFNKNNCYKYAVGYAGVIRVSPEKGNDILLSGVLLMAIERQHEGHTSPILKAQLNKQVYCALLKV